MELPEQIQNAVDNLSKLPGIGNKTALRKVLSLISWDHGDLKGLSQSIRSLCDLKYCQECGFFADDALCDFCASEDRKKSGILCVVESMTDCLAIENSNSFTGLYFVLGGILNPLLGVGPDDLKLNRLQEMVVKNDITEIILALNPSVEGDATCSYIKQILPDGVKVDRIGFGMPIGGSLEFLDSMTITKALENRKVLL